MRTKQRRVEMNDGFVTEVLKGTNSVQVEIESGYYDKTQKEYVKEPITMRLDNPAQAEGLENGMKVAIFKDMNGKVNLVRDGEWKASEPIMVKSEKTGKEYDNGVTVIMGRCVSANLVKPKEGQNFAPFFSMTIVTNDHVRHQIAINNREPYNKDDIEKAMERFKDYLANDKHEFIPFQGTFVTQNSYRQEETDREYNGQTYHNIARSYSSLLALGSFQDYEKAPERSTSRQAEATQEQPEQGSSFDMSAGLAEDGFANIADGFDEELPFD